MTDSQTLDTGDLTPGLRALRAGEPAGVAITSEEISYRAGDVDFGGFVSRPHEVDALVPGVLIISDWSGLGDHARVRAELLAQRGMVALAGDVYGGGRLLPQDAASAEAGKYYSDPALFRRRLDANLDHLRSLPSVDPSRIAVIGYCFGGSAALELARNGSRVAGAVSFHGRLETLASARPGAVSARVLVLSGAADPFVPDDQVVAFQNEMRAAEVEDWQVVSYSGAMHAFAMPDARSPEHGAAFDPRADARSWLAMLSFFEEIFAE